MSHQRTHDERDNLRQIPLIGRGRKLKKRGGGDIMNKVNKAPFPALKDLTNKNV